MKFIKYTEYCDWEGEIWNFYLQIDGNEDELRRLRELLDSSEYGDSYTLHKEILDENEVDILVKHSDMGYLAFHNKVTGKLDLSKFKEPDDFYKGQIANFFI